MDLNTTILGAEVEFLHQPMGAPLRLSSGLITELTEARATVRVRVGGREAIGKGSIYLSDLWAWPHPTLAHEYRDAALRKLCIDIARNLADYCGNEPAHPLELGLRLHHHVCECPSDPEPPLLARAMCLSPFDAAIHDAAGHAVERSAFAFYEAECPISSADALFGRTPSRSAAAAIRGLLRPPAKSLDAWWVVGRSDVLERDIAAAVRRGGFRCFKIKLLGADNADDVQRTVDVYRAARSFGISNPRLTVDSNEANPDAASVLDYLQRLRSQDAQAFASLAYLEQPTARDVVRYPYDWREVSALKPVMLDEGLTSLDVLEAARLQGWNGVALKTCKGHSFALVAAALAQEQGMLLAVQDLTNPGYAALHSALFAAHIPSLNGVELNSPQFTPAANAPWLPRLSGLFEPVNGVHRLAMLLGRAGLASDA